MGSLKYYFWAAAGAIGLIVALLFIRDQNRLQALASYFRKKRVEEDVEVFRKAIAASGDRLALLKGELEKLAAEHQLERGRAAKASQQDVIDFYRSRYFYTPGPKDAA